MSITCPICGSETHVFKISGIVTSGISSGSTTGTTVAGTYSNGDIVPTVGLSSFTTAQATGLARLLLPVSPPEQPRGLKGLSIFLLIGATLFMALCAVLNMGSDGGWTFPAVIIAGVGLLVVLNNNKKNELTEAYTKLRPLYDQYMQIWHRCYYCQKDDIVFDPQTGQQGHPGHFPRKPY